MQNLKQKRQNTKLFNYILLEDGHATVSDGSYWHTVKHNVYLPDGAICVEAKPFLALIKNQANISVTAQGFVKANGNLIGSVSTMSPESFPDTPMLPLEPVATNTINIKEALPFTANNDVRYYLNGVCLSFTDKGLDVVSTDGHRLYRRTYDSANTEGAWIIPLDACKRITKMKNYTISVYAQDYIQASNDTETITVRCIDGEFPQYERAIPSKTEQYVEINRIDLLAKLQLLLPALPKKHTPVKIAHGAVWHGDISYPITITDPEFTGAYNPRYLIAALHHIEGDAVAITRVDEHSAIKITEGATDYVIMPSRL